MNWQQEIIVLSDLQLIQLSAMVASLTEKYKRFCVLDSHAYPKNFHTNGNDCYRLLAGFGKQEELIVGENPLIELQIFLDKNKSNWCFGHLNYDLKNDIEQRLTSHHEDPIGFPILSFFIPEIVIAVKENILTLWFTEKSKLQSVQIKFTLDKYNFKKSSFDKNIKSAIQFEIPEREKYIFTIQEIKNHLHRGDIYELNYCVPFIAKKCNIDPLTIWNDLSIKSPAPLSCFYRMENRWLMSASPERFMRKEGDKIVSQPIKGTARRSSDPTFDEQLKVELINSEKERAENVMIVDLVRNDLSRIAKRGTVHVEELFGLYEFPQVYQLISTLSAEIKDNISFTDILKSLFPMGSMTGAPKISAMQFIEQFESFQRGLFSGAVGYISPENNFDFNVIIRSIFYNEETKTVLIPAGSAITDKSNPESEYEECLLKAKALLERITP